MIKERKIRVTKIFVIGIVLLILLPSCSGIFSPSLKSKPYSMTKCNVTITFQFDNQIIEAQNNRSEKVKIHIEKESEESEIVFEAFVQPGDHIERISYFNHGDELYGAITIFDAWEKTYFFPIILP